MSYEEQYRRYQEMAEAALGGGFERLARGSDGLKDAMRYSLLAGGKRVRPVVLLAFADACGGDLKDALPFACAMEMIHTYSLIHDDLPCMDDDDLRRGKPASHKVYGEATALLAGDGLLTWAFETMLSGSAQPARALEAARFIAAGALEMVGGQALDVAGDAETAGQLTAIDGLKTGALFSAAARAGCAAAGADGKLTGCAGGYGNALGLAFQIIDDILDVEGDPELTGKPSGADAKLNKPTYMKLLGADECLARARGYTEEAVRALEPFGEKAGFLCELARRQLYRIK